MRKPQSQPSQQSQRPLRHVTEGTTGQRGAKGATADQPHHMKFFPKAKGGELGAGVSGPQRNPRFFDYAPMFYIDSTLQSQENDCLLHFLVDAKYLTARGNAPLAARQLWGTDVYTSDSDLLAVLHHQGYIYLQDREPPEGMAKQIEPRNTLSARVINLKRQVAFLIVETILRKHDGTTPFRATERNGLRSRAWSNRYPDGFTIEIKSVRMFGPETEYLGPVSKPEKQLPLPHCISVPNSSRTAGPNSCDGGHAAIHGGGGAASAHHNGDGNNHSKSPASENFVPHKGAFTFSISNEPMISYSLSAVADAGFQKADFLSTRLAKAVMILEDGIGSRYELSATRHGEDSEANISFRWASVKNPIMVDIYGKDASYPLSNEKIVVMEESLPWGKIKWSDQGVSVNDKKIAIKKFSFVDREKELVEG